jgi:hypothetical protein
LSAADEGVREGVQVQARGLCEVLGEGIGGVVDVGARGFHKPVGVQEEHGAGGKEMSVVG